MHSMFAGDNANPIPTGLRINRRPKVEHFHQEIVHVFAMHFHIGKIVLKWTENMNYKLSDVCIYKAKASDKHINCSIPEHPSRLGIAELDEYRVQEEMAHLKFCVLWNIKKHTWISLIALKSRLDSISFVSRSTSLNCFSSSSNIGVFCFLKIN